jgi:BirA family biotin operon repressor/biotin-[acetyl-CoA-carboxylase] ligase
MIDTRQLASRLRTIESIVLMPRVRSTNELARRIMDECFENELPFPSAVLVAREQSAGRGRAARTWYSPRDAGIYATVMHTRSKDDLPLIPFAIGNIVAGFLREVYRIEARLKWPNDVLANGKKVAGILIEARQREEEVSLIIGVGINVAPLAADAPEHATSIAELTGGEKTVDLTTATTAFIEYFDDALSATLDRDQVLDTWRSLAVHQRGDRLSCVLPSGNVSGTWEGVDEQGRAMIREGSRTTYVTAGDLILEDAS